MAEKVTKIAVSDNDAEKDIAEETTKDNTQESTTQDKSPEPVKAEETVTVSGEKRIEPLSQPDNSAEKNLETEKPTEPQEQATPDSSQLMTAKAEAQMQNPKLFDTKEYHLPITQSVHGHGSKFVAVIFGIIFAFLALGAVLYFLQ